MLLGKAVQRLSFLRLLSSGGVSSFDRPFSFLVSRCYLTSFASSFCSLSSAQPTEKIMSKDSIAIHPAAYPEVPRNETIIDDYHGVKVADPYRGLENPDAKVTKKFVDDLNAISKPFLDASPIRDKLTQKLTELWDYEKFGCTAKHGDYYYYYHNTGLQNQWVYYRQRELDGKGEVFFDPNTLSDDGTTAIGLQSWSDDGRFFAYGLREKGSDWTTIKFRDADGNDLTDVIPGVRFSSIDWLADNSGIFYSKYPDIKEFEARGSCTTKLKFHALYFHKIGTDPTKDDVIVAQFCDNEDYMVNGSVSEDGRFLIVDVSLGCSPENQIHYFDLAAVDNKINGQLALKPLFTKWDANYEVVDTDGDWAIVRTNHNASMFKLVRVRLDGSDWDAPERWQPFLPEDPKRKLGWASAVGYDKLIVSYVEDVKDTLYVYDLKSAALLHKIPLPICSMGGCFLRKNRTEFFISFDSYFVPTVVCRGDFATAPDGKVQLEEIRRVRIDGLDADMFQLEQVFYPSKDGTKIPMYIITRKDAKQDGTGAMLLNGYGGFNISYLPDFSIARLCLVRHFDIGYAIANLRGGSEYGEDWHRAGMLANKQNVFDDFIAAGEYLISKGYTTPSRLAIQGGSNGGLLVGVCSAQRSDLFGAALNRVGVLDMLRFSKFTIGSAWIPEYGNPEKKEDFENIYKYSPLHNIRLAKDKQFPATLLMTADHDDRVVPSHTLKYIAQFYHHLKTEADWQRNPIIARIEVKAGHGAGKPTAKVIAEIVDIYCFLERAINLKWQN